jgi:hypothetical protein
LRFEASPSKQFKRPYHGKNPTQKNRADGVAQGRGSEFKPQYCKINKLNKLNKI